MLQGRTCFLCRGDPMMELRRSGEPTPHRVTFDNGDKISLSRASISECRVALKKKMQDSLG